MRWLIIALFALATCVACRTEAQKIEQDAYESTKARIDGERRAQVEALMKEFPDARITPDMSLMQAETQRQAFISCRVTDQLEGGTYWMSRFNAGETAEDLLAELTAKHQSALDALGR